MDSDRVATRIAELSKQRVKTVKAIGISVPHDVALPTELFHTLIASKMVHVPGLSFCLCALISQNYLRRIRNRPF